MTALRVIAIDPGPVPGVVVLDYEDRSIVRREALQCSPGLLFELLELGLDPGRTALVAVERFVAHGRLSLDQRRTMDQVAALQRARPGAVLRPAAAVKPWATDDRLAAAELLEPTKGMRHARDAARHALFAAVRDGGLTDPLSRRARVAVEQ